MTLCVIEPNKDTQNSQGYDEFSIILKCAVPKSSHVKVTHGEREKKIVISSLVQFLYYKELISFQESSSLLSRIKRDKAEKMLGIFYKSKSFADQISIPKKLGKYWLNDTAWRIRMRREMLLSIGKGCAAAAFMASKLKEDHSNELVYSSSNLSDALSIMLDTYSEINAFNINPPFDASVTDNFVIPVMLGFETNVEIARKDEIPYFAMNLLYHISEVKRKISKVIPVYSKMIDKKMSRKSFSNTFEKSIFKQFFDHPSSVPIEKWHEVCFESLEKLKKNMVKTFGNPQIDDYMSDENLPTPLIASISWFNSKRNIEETLEVILEVPITSEKKEDGSTIYG